MYLQKLRIRFPYFDFVKTDADFKDCHTISDGVFIVEGSFMLRWTRLAPPPTPSPSGEGAFTMVVVLRGLSPTDSHFWYGTVIYDTINHPLLYALLKKDKQSYLS
jgi:hypothetical protein